MAPNKEQIAQLFSKLSDPNTTKSFFDSVDENVTWFVLGNTAISGQYDSKKAFFDGTFEILNGKVLDGPLRLKTVSIVGGGESEWATVELEAIDSTCKNGMPYPMKYCWVIKFGEKDLITVVRAYVDTQLLTEAIASNS